MLARGIASYGSGIAFLLAAQLAFAVRATAQQDPDPARFAEWKHRGEWWLITTQDGANLRDGAMVTEFPVVVRLDREHFPFAEARPDGADLRIVGEEGTLLDHEIERFDSVAQEAVLWIRVPRIVGNAQQRLLVLWGNSNAKPTADARKVFGPFNGYVSALHLGDELTDSTGSVALEDRGTTATRGRIGTARHFADGRGIFGGDAIETFPSGSAASSTEAWFYVERPRQTVVAWGAEKWASKVMLNLESPPHVAIGCYFADVVGTSPLKLGQWNHVIHTYERGNSRVYLNGVLDGVADPILEIPKRARLDIGGWYDHSFDGDIDEVRISSVARSPEWIHLQYENQKPLQTLVGSRVRSGSAFSVSAPEFTVNEGESFTLRAEAGGARRVEWRLLRGSLEEVVAVDSFEFTYAAPRVEHDEVGALRFLAVFADGARTIDVPFTIREHVPEPRVELTAPASWDGRTLITLSPTITFDPAAKGTSSTPTSIRWQLSGIACTKTELDERLLLERAQGSGKLTITCTVANGGAPRSQSITIEVKEPASDPWVERPRLDEEHPEPGQFVPRQPSGTGALVHRGQLAEPAESVFLRVFADGKPYAETKQEPRDGRYAIEVGLKPGLVRYAAEYGVIRGGRETAVTRVEDLVCGDAYLVIGQSNALATDFEGDDPPDRNVWVRTFGSTSGDSEQARLHEFGVARCRDRERGAFEVGYWALKLGARLVESSQVPICIVNGAVGGTRIDQHQRNANDPEDVATIYGRLLWRVKHARLTHGIRAILWHQGENDQGADGPSGRYGYETYHDLFVELAAGWRRDYPNVEHFYLFQIWPKACAMGIDGSDDMLREVQRQLPRSFSRLSVMSTLGIDPPGGCHYPFEGWAEFARLIQPLIERDLYGVNPQRSITPPDLIAASFSDDSRQRITLTFDQPIAWQDALAREFLLDDVRGSITSGRVEGNTLVLELAEPTRAHTITYLDSDDWNPKNVLRGANGIAALTFCRVPIAPTSSR